MAEQIPLADFTLDTQKLQKSLSDLQDNYFDLRKEQKAFADQSKATAKEIDTLTKAQELLTDASGDNSKEIEENKKQLDSLTKTQKDLYKSEQNLGIQMGTVRKEINQTTTQLRAYQDTEGKTKSLIDLGNDALGKQIKNKNDARAANIALNNVANQLNPNIGEEATLLKQLNAQMDKNTQFIKDNSSETAKQKMNVGNYQSALQGVDSVLNKFGIDAQGARDAMEGFTSTISKASNDLANYITKMFASSTATEANTAASTANAATTEEQAAANATLTTATEATTVATTASTLSIGAFTVALAATGIGLIVIALGSLVSYLTNTQSGIDKLNSVLEPLKAILATVTSLASGLGSKLVSAFENPKKALSDLGDFVKQNLINRFSAFGVILDGIINLDFKKVANGVLQVGTGVENVTGKIAGVANATSKLFADSIAKGQQVAAATKQINDLQLKYEANQVAVNDALDEQLLISKDTSKSFKERAAAANQIIAITEKNGQAEASILDLELKRLKLQQSIKGAQNLTNEDKRAELELIAKIDDAEDRGKEARLEQLKVLSGLKKEQKAADDKAAADELTRLLQNSKEKIDHFIAEQGFAKKSAEDQRATNKSLAEQLEADAKLRFEKGKISETAYQTELLNIGIDFAKKDAELTIANANTELQTQLDKNSKILESTKFLSDEQKNLRETALNENLLAEENFQKVRLEKGVINQQEYDAAVNAAKEENRLKEEQLAAERLAAEQEKQLTDLENQKVAQADNFIAQADLQTAQNEIKRQQEVAAAETTGASVADINAKYAKLAGDIEEQKQLNKVQLASDAFGSLSSIFGAESKAGKAFAIAQATMDTFKGAVSAYSALSGITFVGPILGAIAAAAAVAAGVANVKKITATKEPSIKAPSYAGGVIGIRGAGSGTSDDISANLSAGESVINAKSTSMFANELNRIQQAGGGTGINGASNILNQNQIDSNSNNNQMAQIIAAAVASGAEIGTANGSKNGIRSLSDDRKVMADAKF